jgi:vesicle-fusing ATPase
MLAPDFPGVSIDPILLRLSDPTVEPGYVDPRHCLVFWARPTQKVKDLILQVQNQLQTVAPSTFSPYRHTRSMHYLVSS